MKVLQIATLGEEEDQIFIGLREYPVSKLVLLHEPKDRDRALDILRKVGALKIEGERHEVRDPSMDVYELVAQILQQERGRFDDVFINVSSGRKLLTCSAISAAFVNGVKAFHVEGNTPMLLPVLKFSYSEVVSESKIGILRALERLGGSAGSLNDLGASSGIDKSLLSYHIRGGKGSKGLEELGLVEVNRATQGRLTIRLTPMGRLLLIGARTPERGKG